MKGKMTIVMGIVMIALAILMFPMVLTGTNEILSHNDIDDYTGLGDIASIAPTIIFLALIVAGSVTTVKGVRKQKKGK